MAPVEKQVGQLFHVVQVLRHTVLEHDHHVGIDLFAFLRVFHHPGDQLDLVLLDLVHHTGRIAVEDLVLRHELLPEAVQAGIGENINPRDLFAQVVEHPPHSERLALTPLAEERHSEVGSNLVEHKRVDLGRPFFEWDQPQLAGICIIFGHLDFAQLACFFFLFGFRSLWTVKQRLWWSVHRKAHTVRTGFFSKVFCRPRTEKMRHSTSHFGLNRTNAKTPIVFPFQGAPGTFEQAGAFLAQPANAVSDFSVAQISNQPLIRGPESSLFRKFKAPVDPLKAERGKGFEAPPNVMHKKKEEIYDALLRQAAGDPAKSAAIEIAKRQNLDAAVTTEVNEDFTCAFNNWLLKRGRRQDHIAAGWWDAKKPAEVPKFIQAGGLLSNHPSVHSYVKDIVLARTKFEQKLVEMKMEAQTAGVNHWPVDKLYLYYKYVVRGMEPDDADVVALCAPAPLFPGPPAPAAPVGPPRNSGAPPIQRMQPPPPPPTTNPGGRGGISGLFSSVLSSVTSPFSSSSSSAPPLPPTPPPTPPPEEEIEELLDEDLYEEEEARRREEEEKKKAKAAKRAAKEAAKKKAEDDAAAAKKKADEEVAAKKKADEEAAAKKKYDEVKAQEEKERQERENFLDRVKTMRTHYERGEFESGDLLLQELNKPESQPSHSLYSIHTALTEAINFRHAKEKEQLDAWEARADKDATEARVRAEDEAIAKMASEVRESIKQNKEAEADELLKHFARLPSGSSVDKHMDLYKKLLDELWPSPKNSTGEAEEEAKTSPETPSQDEEEDDDDYPDDEPEPAPEPGPKAPEPTPPPRPLPPPASDPEHLRLMKIVGAANRKLSLGDLAGAEADINALLAGGHGGYDDVADAIADLMATRANLQKGKEAASSPPEPPTPSPPTERPKATVEQILGLYQTFVDQDQKRLEAESARLQVDFDKWDKERAQLIGANKELVVKRKELEAQLNGMENELAAHLISNREFNKAKAQLLAENVRLGIELEKLEAEAKLLRKTRGATMEAYEQHLRNEEYAKKVLEEIKAATAAHADAQEQANLLQRLENEQRQREAEQEHERGLREKEIRLAEAEAIKRTADLEYMLEENKLRDAKAEIESLRTRLLRAVELQQSGRPSASHAMVARLQKDLRGKQAFVEEQQRKLKEQADTIADLARIKAAWINVLEFEAPEQDVREVTTTKRRPVESQKYVFAAPVGPSPTSARFDAEFEDLMDRARGEPHERRREEMRKTRVYQPLIPASSVDPPSSAQLANAPFANRDVLMANTPFQFSGAPAISSSPLSSTSGIGMGVPDARTLPRPNQASEKGRHYAGRRRK